jgi:hypothetical protein
MSPETAETIRRVADGVQWINLAASIALLMLVLAAGYFWPRWRRALTLPLGYAVAAVAFYVAALVDIMPGPMASLLSALLRLYAHVMMLATLGVIVYVALTDDIIDDHEGDYDA